MSSKKVSAPPVLSPNSLRGRDVTFTQESGKQHHVSAAKATSPTQQVPPLLGLSGVDDVGDPSAPSLQPRKSFLLKDVLSQQPTAFCPKYVTERSSLPPDRWIRRSGQSKWKSIPNPRSGTPSLLVPGYASPPGNLSWDDVDDATEERSVLLGEEPTPHRSLQTPFTTGGASSSSVTPLKYFSTSAHNSPPPGNKDAKLPSAQSPQGSNNGLRDSPEPKWLLNRNVHSRQPFLHKGSGQLSSSPAAKTTSPSASPTKTAPLLKGTPLNNGVQDAWCSSYVQLGPFRNLVVYQHDPPGHSVNGIPIDVLPPGTKKLTPLEQHRVEHAQQEFMRARTPSTHHGHVSSELARKTHIGLPTAHTRPPSSTASLFIASPERNKRSGSSENSQDASQSRHTQPGAGGAISPPHPAMHFALPRTLVLPLPESVNPPSQLPPKSPARVFVPCAHRGLSRDDNDEVLGCRECHEVNDELQKFDEVRESKEARLYQHQLDMWREQQLREEDAKTIPPDMMRTKSGRLVKRLVILDEGPTVAQLYHGTSHEDREALYVSTCGGLSFDISKERFTHLVQKVLAPRIHVRLSDDQAAAMFQAFDVDGNGSISYLEYLAVLTLQLLSPEQRAFLDDLFNALYRLPFINGGLDAKTASRVMLEHHAQLELEGANASFPVATAPGTVSNAPALEASISGRRRSMHMLRRRSTKFLAASVHGDASLILGDDGSPTSEKAKKKAAEKPQMYLTKAHITLERTCRIVYELKKHNPWFPHPLDDAFAEAVVGCFKPLHEEDRVNLPKFRMFLFCDDDCMPALERLYPRE